MTRDELLALIEQRGVTWPHGPKGEGYDIQQHPQELADFLLYMQRLGVQSVLELGTGVHGGFARFLADDMGWSVTSVDIQRPSYVSPRATFVQARTIDAHNKLPRQHYDLVFIDADHSYDAVEQDWSLYAVMAQKAVAFHDIVGLRGAEGSGQHWRDHAYEDGTLKPGWHEHIHDASADDGEWRIGIGWYEVQKADVSGSATTPDYTPSDILLSIVSGTYNRFKELKDMIASARERIPAGIPYEFVIVDGGSTDGTLDWLRKQPDVVLIEHGELRGAIQAFTEGGYAARGEHVIMANDDIVFRNDSIMKALAHLEANPRCGAVAFADNRPMVGYAPGHKVLHMQARHKGKKVSVIYPQVGMYRKWLGDLADWWGGNDPIMGQPGLIYGADNYLAARIVEMGYTTEAVPGVEIDDLFLDDELRSHNYEVEYKNPGKYHERYPHGPTIPDAPQYSNPQNERLRILLAHVFEPQFKGRWQHKCGLRDALMKRGIVYEVVINEDAQRLPQIARDWQPHLIITQCMAGDCMSIEAVRKTRQNAPSAVWLNWNGDVWPENLTSPDMLTWLREVDAQLTVNASVLDVYEREGIPAAYWQIGYEPVESVPDMPAHDVLFLGNCYSDKRRELGVFLRSLDGVNVGIYGVGWQQHGITEDGETNYDYPAMAALVRNATVVIGDNQFPDQRGFISNRVFNTLGQGGFLLHQEVDGLEDLTGLKNGKHYVAWSDLDDLKAQLDKWLDGRRKSTRRKIANAGRKHVAKRYSFDSLVEQLFNEIIPAIAEKAKAA